MAIKNAGSTKRPGARPNFTTPNQSERAPLQNPGPHTVKGDGDHTDAPPVAPTSNASNGIGGETNADRVLGTAGRSMTNRPLRP